MIMMQTKKTESKILKAELTKTIDSNNIAIIVYKIINNKKGVINIEALSTIKKNDIYFKFSQVNYKNKELYNEIIESLKTMKLK